MSSGKIKLAESQTLRWLLICRGWIPWKLVVWFLEVDVCCGWMIITKMTKQILECISLMRCFNELFPAKIFSERHFITSSDLILDKWRHVSRSENSSTGVVNIFDRTDESEFVWMFLKTREKSHRCEWGNFVVAYLWRWKVWPENAKAI